MSELSDSDYIRDLRDFRATRISHPKADPKNQKHNDRLTSIADNYDALLKAVKINAACGSFEASAALEFIKPSSSPSLTQDPPGE